MEKITFEKAFELLSAASELMVSIPDQGWLYAKYILTYADTSDPEDPDYCFLDLKADNDEGLGWELYFFVDDNKEVSIDTENNIMLLKGHDTEFELRLMVPMNLEIAIA